MIEIMDLTKTFGDFTALDAINLTITKGKAFGIVGSNGAGKSTLLRLLIGVYKQDGGEVAIDGEKVYDNVSAKQKIFFINDETIQFQNYTLAELRDFYRCFYPKFSMAFFEELRGKIGLPLNKKISTFSKGMKRQSIVIIGLACQTDYLLLDEAFDGLDPAMRLIVKRMIFDAMLDRELTLIISSHNLHEINEMCDSAAMIHNGKIIFAKELDDLRSNVHKLQIVFPNNDDGSVRGYTAQDIFACNSTGAAYSDNENDILHFERQGSIYHIIVKGDPEKLKSLIKDKNPVVFELLPLTLEEIFIYELEMKGYDSSGIKQLEGDYEQTIPNSAKNWR